MISLVSQVASAIDYAHCKGVIHRDIKPSNLILYEADRVKVTDFGIAKLADSEMTHSGTLLGTPSYMSPEQAMGEKLDGRSDIFSLGVVPSRCSPGQQPFPGTNVTSILYKLVHVDPVEPANLEMNGLVPQKWHEVFHKVLAKKPESRYQTATAFVQDLEYCLGAWFAGLGNEETISLQMPVPDETTVTIPRMAAPAVPAAARSDGSPAESDTLVLPGPRTGRGRRAGHDPRPGGGATAGRDGPAAGRARDRGPGARPDGRDGAARGEPDPAARAHGARPGSGHGGRAPGAPGRRARRLGLRRRGRRRGPGPRHRGLGPVAALPGGRAGGRAPGAGRRGLARSPRRSRLLPTVGALRVESEPPGARVRVNGQAKGQTPLRLADLPFGAYEVRVEQKGYEAQTRAVSLDAGSPSAEVRVALARPAAPASGAADILSTPSGAAVSVDGRPVGTTPLSGLKLKPGTRRIEVALDEHETWTGSVDVAAGETGRVEVRLRAIAKPPAPPTPEPVDTARVYENTPGEVDAPAKKLSGSSPSYPSDRAGRLKSGERVSVLVRFVVTETGEVQDVSVVESGGKAVDDVVVSAIRGWKFQPATKRGTRVKVQVVFKQTFLGG